VVSLVQFTPRIAAAFLASLAECVEAATMVSAVGTVRGWHSTFAGNGLALLAFRSLLQGPALAARAWVMPATPARLDREGDSGWRARFA
jgi:uncharacterized membrane protein